MTHAFLDTVGLLAVWNSSDQWHAVATAVYQQLLALRRPILTTTFVLLECGNAASRNSVLRSHVADARRWLERNDLLIVPTADDWTEAWAAYERREAGH